MTRYFSPSTGGFYVEVVHGARQTAEAQTEAQIAAKRKPRMLANPDTLIPADAVEVEAADYYALMLAQAEGQRIIARGGQPVAVDPLPPEPAAQLDIIRARRNRLLSATDMMVAVPDYPLSAANRDELIAWRAALRDLTNGIDGDAPFDSVVWPAFPAWLTLFGLQP